MNYLIYFTASILVGVGFLLITQRLKRHKCLILSDWLILGLVVYGGLVVPLIFTFVETGTNPGLLVRFSSHQTLWIYPLYSLFGVLGLSLANRIHRRKLTLIALQSRTSHATSLSSNKLAWIAWGMLLIAIACYWLYARAYGGFLGLLDVSSYIRSGLLDRLNVNTTYSFLKRFGGFAFFATLIFSSMILAKRGHGRVLNLFTISGFVLSFCFSMYVLFSWEGRLAFIAFPISIALGTLFMRKGFSIYASPKIIALFLIPVFLLPISSAWWGKDGEVADIKTFFVKELSFPVIGFANTMEKSNYRLMRDVVQAPLYLLPSRIWKKQFNLDTATNQNTKNITGVYKGENDSTVSVPIDFVTFGAMQLHFAGVILYGFIVGMLLIKLHYWIISKTTHSLASMLIAYSAIFIAVMSTIYADPYHIIIRNFHFVVGLFLLSRIRRPKKRSLAH